MVRALDSGSSGPRLSPGQGHCVVFLGKTLAFAVLPPPRSINGYGELLGQLDKMLGDNLWWTCIQGDRRREAMHNLASGKSAGVLWTPVKLHSFWNRVERELGNVVWLKFCWSIQLILQHVNNYFVPVTEHIRWWWTSHSAQCSWTNVRFSRGHQDATRSCARHKVWIHQEV